MRSVAGPALLVVDALLLAGALSAQDANSVLVVVNDNSALSKTIGEYYVRRRSIPLAHVCHLKVAVDEEIARADYDRLIATPIAQFLQKNRLVESVLYIVTTMGVPLRVAGDAEHVAAVDSELALLYSDMKQGPHKISGFVPNPFYDQPFEKFRHPEYPMYLVTRLAAYDFEGVKAIIDRALLAKNVGKFVIDARGSSDVQGDNWLHAAARLLPKDRVIADDTDKVLYDQKDVIGYASWGSNDFARKKRFVGFQWLPGAIMTEFVSTNGRTFKRPPENWTLSTWKKEDQHLWFAGAPQTMTADYILEGATGASGHVAEPYLHMCPRPDLLLPAYFRGRNLAESYYLSMRGLSWQNIVIGDPLCNLGKAGK